LARSSSPRRDVFPFSIDAYCIVSAQALGRKVTSGVSPT